ncbi:MAG: hypothetical protein SFW09_14455 [Hyphomicrobiaceae bacterium]|nr:hypothetical protein [Hyphomicrobiaceae bacterium]
MTEPSHVFEGRCHCGAIAVKLAFTRPAEEMQVRSCQCAFCTRHGSLTVSDPAGRAVIEVEAGQLTPYKFGTRTATSLLCARCGVYAGVVIADGDKLWSVANARGLGIEAFEGRVGMQMFYEEETADERIARRKQKWTPTEIRFKL